MYWAVAQTESQREAVAQMHLERQGFTCYLPRIRVERRNARVNGHEAAMLATVPLFPSYLFIEVLERWYAINATIGVVHVLADGEHPARVPDAVITELRAREGSDGLIVLPSRPAFVRGDRVRIIRGALHGQLAIFQDMQPKKRVELLLHILGAQRRIKVKRRDIRRI